MGGDPRYPELPAIPTTLEQLEAKARKLLSQLAELPLDEIVANLNASLISFDQLISDPALASAIQELNHTLVGTRAAVGDARKLVQNLDAQVEPLADSTRGTLDRASDALASVEPGSPLNHQLGTALQELSEAAQALRALATTLEQQPNALLFGRTGEP